MLFCPFGGYPVFNVFNKVIRGCRLERFADLSVCYNRLQFADSIAVWVYAFGITMVILVALEPFMFLSRKRWLRGGRGRQVATQTVEDRGTIREIPLLKRLPANRSGGWKIERSSTRRSKREEQRYEKQTGKISVHENRCFEIFWFLSDALLESRSFTTSIRLLKFAQAFQRMNSNVRILITESDFADQAVY